MSAESVNVLTVTVFIEIAKGSHIKYEYDKEKKALCAIEYCILHLNQRRIKIAHFNSSGSDTSNDLKRAP